MSNIIANWRSLLAGTAFAAAFAAAPISLQLSPMKTLSLSFDGANAKVGHPLSPGSVAGINRRVQRRTARRDYYYGGAAALGAAGAYYGVASPGYNNGYYYGNGYSSSYASPTDNLYGYAPGTAATQAQPTSAATQAQPTSQPTSEVKPTDNAEHLPDLYAYCRYRNYGVCPQQ